MPQNISIHSPVTVLSGVSSVRQKQFERLGVHTLGDLLSFFPRAYEDRTKTVSIRDLSDTEPACFEAMVVSSAKISRIRKGLEITKVQVADMSGKLNLIFFNQPYVADSLHYGESYIFYGTLRQDMPSQMQNPIFEHVERAGTVTGRYFPIYPLTAGLSNNVVLKCVRQALDLCLDEVQEVLPEQVRERYGLCPVHFAYETIHAPQNETALEAARRRLVFEEFFIFSAGLQLLRGRRSIQSRAAYDCAYIEKFTQVLPFTLTNAQQ
ncbi:MAG: ATP-dependent DNA helicase RecG, partial [Oscillospiraceae bacterium]|nr:ATP-dependent DNA helicase RecG [Oscillospiraceae bacterium]